MFILQPAAYIGMIRFPGATKVFLYTRLLQAMNIPEQSPYVKDEVPVARKALPDFFASEGFFQATVDPEIQADEAHGIVNVIYKVDLKQTGEDRGDSVRRDIAGGQRRIARFAEVAGGEVEGCIDSDGQEIYSAEDE